MEYNPVLTELGLAPYVPLTVQSQYVFQKLLQRWVILKKWPTFAALVKLHLWPQNARGFPKKTLETLFFCGAKK